MPRTYTNEGGTLGDAIEDHYWGSHGVNTGSFPNQLGLDEYNRRQAEAAAGRTVPARGRRAGKPMPTPVTDFMKRVLPRWVYWLCAFIGATGACTVLVLHGYTEPVGLAVGIAIGAALAPAALMLTFVLIDLLLSLLLIAIMGACAVGVFWAIAQFAG